MRKNSRNYKQSAKSQIIEAIKVFSYYLKIAFLIQLLSVLIEQNINWTNNKFTCVSFKGNRALLLREKGKRREKETQILTTHKIL